MTMKVLFVHGTGVRKQSYEQTAARIHEGLNSIRKDFSLEPCLWGDSLGAKLNLDGKSIPNYAGVEDAPPADASTALWSLLYRDPLFELRELSSDNSDTPLVPPKERERLKAFPETVLKLADNTEILDRLRDPNWPQHWRKSVNDVAGNDIIANAPDKLTRISGTLRLAVARALVATFTIRLADAEAPALDHGLRDELVQQSLNKLGGLDKALVDSIKGRLIGLAASFASSQALRRRDAVFDAAYPAAGDILLYQARGQVIRDFIAEKIETCGEGLVVIAHSLGGIACMDLLISRPLPQVKLLVTVGSQASFLYEIGALVSLPFGQPLPEHFPAKWLNFYDPNDLLSYLAAPIFTGRVLDYKIRSEQPFPQSHSAYWNEPRLWDKLGPHLNE